MQERESAAEAAFHRDLRKVKDSHFVICVEKRFVPEGAQLVECYETAREFVICGDPEEGEDEHGNPIHNCDEMGCCTFSHVVARFPRRSTNPSTATLKAVREALEAGLSAMREQPPRMGDDIAHSDYCVRQLEAEDTMEAALALLPAPTEARS